MKKIGKWLAVCVLALIVVATLCACGNNNGNKPSGVEGCHHVDANVDFVCDKCYRDMDGDCVHIDKNDDGKCDLCKTSVLVDIDFYAINDLHGMYVATETQPGVAGLTTYLNEKKNEGNTVVLASGDMWQGSTESNNTKGKLATEWLNYIGCESMTLGNHEFDWTTEKIRTNAAIAEFPILAINVYEHATNARASYCQPSVMIKRDGAKIGIIGAIGDCYSSISASVCRDVYFKTGTELTSLIKAESEKLKKQGADYIVLSIHSGYSKSGFDMKTVSDNEMHWYDSSLSNGYIDVVFEAHTHRSYMLVDKYGVKHIQAGGYNKGISHADVCVNFANGKNSTSVNIVDNDVYAQYEEDGIVDSLLEKYKAEIGNPDEVVGYNADYRSSEQLRNYMAQAYMQKGQSVWGDRYDIVLAGGYIKARTPGYLPAGNVTVKQIQTLFPFDNEMHLCAISGYDLVSRYFDNDDYVFTVSEYGESVREKLKSGVDLNKTYYIVTDSYNTDYGPNNLTMVETLGKSTYPRDCLIEYIKAGNLASWQ